ncbi:50S ribosomal protein L23 [Candidatus Woesebacteria bacterium RIFOXYB1_FULL_38_16]|uniref:50S ribosomal protein L23 n=1 Tax=Candidatus Woesebacteria bacterium RIFOXYB1_FULL_38_16 TaxID=1802538 RepID=A0A1F8CUP8_9BACT|nr:MAG: 50S ribosomal protein L23 [Candidatus Woesebacteria bacterium RIFOXYA1_FULL_38_9]OGM80040.1 MAG: 50S ribosomal protein L23 [Candidatus Woesebacteria bacterium RIFOXYB1_FULL_38_16]
MSIKPILTEKSMADAKNGKYSFWTSPFSTKGQIKVLVGRLFGVKVKTVKTMNYKGRVKLDNFRKKVQEKPKKKAIVTLVGKDKIALFTEGAKKS